MLLVDLKSCRIVRDYEIKMRLARRQPYRRWVDENQVAIHGFSMPYQRWCPTVTAC